MSFFKFYKRYCANWRNLTARRSTRNTHIYYIVSHRSDPADSAIPVLEQHEPLILTLIDMEKRCFLELNKEIFEAISLDFLHRASCFRMRMSDTVSKGYRTILKALYGSTLTNVLGCLTSKNHRTILIFLLLHHHFSWRLLLVFLFPFVQMFQCNLVLIKETILY